METVVIVEFKDKVSCKNFNILLIFIPIFNSWTFLAIEYSHIHSDDGIPFVFHSISLRISSNFRFCGPCSSKLCGLSQVSNAIFNVGHRSSVIENTAASECPPFSTIWLLSIPSKLKPINHCKVFIWTVDCSFEIFPKFINTVERSASHLSPKTSIITFGSEQVISMFHHIEWFEPACASSQCNRLR